MRKKSIFAALAAAAFINAQAEYCFINKYIVDGGSAGNISLYSGNTPQATTQALNRLVVNVNGSQVLDYTNSGSYLIYAPEFIMYGFTMPELNLKLGDEVEVILYPNRWNGTRVVGFDWDKNEAWEGDEVKVDLTEPADKSQGFQSGESKTITFKVPKTAQLGESRMRIICDGQVSTKTYSPEAEGVLCNGTYPGEGAFSYAGSVNDIKVNVEWADVPDEEDTTKLSSMQAENEDGAIFDLLGKKVNASDLQKGQIYIKNGKKFTFIK